MLANSLPELITYMSEKKGTIITYEDLTHELNRKDNNVSVYNIDVKNNDHLAILYYNDIMSESKSNLENNCRSIIIEKDTLRIIGSQFNKIIYNDDAINYLKNSDWNKVIIQKCYEGTMLLVYHHNDEWYVSTRRCLNSDNSHWIKNKSYREMFDESKTFDFDDLNTNYCYHFALVHYKNRNIVSYSEYGEEYKKLFHVTTTKKYTLEEVDVEINGSENIEVLQYNDLNEVIDDLQNISDIDEIKKNVSTEGYIFKVYEGEPHKSPFTVLKLQTPLYQKLMSMKPNNSNLDQIYMELYQRDQLFDFLPYFSKYTTDIIRRINISLKTIAKEILNLYHGTRQKKNPHIYKFLSDKYKKVLYGLHGIYIEHRKMDFEKNSFNKKNVTRSINVHDVYYYLKQLPPHELRQLYLERSQLAEQHLIYEDTCKQVINDICTYTITMTNLMFDDI